MSSMTPPQRSQPPGSAHGAPQGRPAQAPPAHPDAMSGAETAESRAFSLADFFADALDGAMLLVHADGGEIATLDETRSGQAMVLRARRTRPRFDPTLGPMGAPARHSQPASSASHSYPGASSGGSFSRGYIGGPPSRPDDLGGPEAIEEQSTQLLPAALLSRTYRRGERLIGYCWQRAEPVVMRGDECRALPGGRAPQDTDAAWHLAVPILRPASLAIVRPSTDVIGVISVYNHDPLWSFTARDVELLTLHADRIARAMHAADLARQSQSQADLLTVLGTGLNGEGGQSIYQRLRDVVRRMIDAPSFAVLLYDPRHNEVTVEPNEHDGRGADAQRLRAAALPPWWQAAQSGRTICISAPEDRALHPEYCVLGWSDDGPIQSILVAPLAARGQLLGALVAASPRPDVYAPEHARLFTAIARSAATVIQNAWLVEETRKSLDRTKQKEEQLSKLNNAMLTLNASLEIDTTVRELARHAKELTEAEVCAVFLVDEHDKNTLVGHAANIHLTGPHTGLAEMRVPLAWHDMDKTLQTGQFQLLANLEAEWGDDTPVGEWLAEYRVKSCLVVPLVHKDKPAHDGKVPDAELIGEEKLLGALLVYTPDQHYHFMPREIGLLQGFASQGAGALSNALLFRKQQELDRLKEQFILTVSHEFRTPVTAIEGYVTLISRHGQKLDQGKLGQFAEEIHLATNQLMGMINMLNDANSIESKPLQLTTRPVRLRAVAETAIALQSPEAKARMNLKAPDDLWVLADEERLRTVISNLLSNAVKYSPASKPVNITARAESRERLAHAKREHAQAESAPGRWVVVGVRDQGEGITPEDQTKLFKKFVRLSRSLTTSVRGTGLGLWICREYVEAMGGDIWVESEYGNGAHFQFSLPCVAPPQEASA